MSTEIPKPYKRRQFDESKHCGGKVDRDPESLRERSQKYQARIDELRAIQQDRELTKLEMKILARKVNMAHFVELKLAKLERDGPDDRLCMQPKGKGTDHPSVGMCFVHCACKGRESFHAMNIYTNKLRDTKLRDLMDQMDAMEHDILDLSPDVMMLRAKIKLFLDEKKDFEPETVKSLTLLSEVLRKTVETINNKKFQTLITRDTFDLILYRMAEAMMKYVTDPEVLDKIQLEWARISVETTTKRGSIAQHAQN